MNLLFFYNDPTLYLSDEIIIGWGIGEKGENYYLETISKIITEFSESNNIQKNNILFFGSSGGGFTSIQLGTLIKQSTVLVNNAQTILKNYIKEDHYKKLMKISFTNLNEKDIYKNYAYRLNVFEMFKRENYVPHIIFYVNAESKRDTVYQLAPFVKGFRKLNILKKSIQIILYADNRANKHMALGKWSTIKIIWEVSKNNLYNSKEGKVTSYPQLIKLQDNDETLIERNKYLYRELEEYEKRNKYLYRELKKYKKRRIVKIIDNLSRFKRRLNL